MPTTIPLSIYCFKSNFHCLFASAEYFTICRNIFFAIHNCLNCQFNQYQSSKWFISLWIDPKHLYSHEDEKEKQVKRKRLYWVCNWNVCIFVMYLWKANASVTNSLPPQIYIQPINNRPIRKRKFPPFPRDVVSYVNLCPNNKSRNLFYTHNSLCESLFFEFIGNLKNLTSR